MVGPITASGGTGAKTLTGALVGDMVLSVHSPANASLFTNQLRALFENVISVNDQIQQIETVDLANEDPLQVVLLR
jgi:hypothetical protein